MPRHKGFQMGPGRNGPQNPMTVNLGPFRAEYVLGTGHDEYFQTREEMLAFMIGKTEIFTPMVWNSETEMYKIDFDSAYLLGQ